MDVERIFSRHLLLLDVIATISLYSEVPFVEQAIFGGAGTVARAGRAARGAHGLDAYYAWSDCCVCCACCVCSGR